MKLWPVPVWPPMAVVEVELVVPLLTFGVDPVVPCVEPVVPERDAPPVEPDVEPVVPPEAEPVVEPDVLPEVDPVVLPDAEPVVLPEVEPVVEPPALPVVEPEEPPVEPDATPEPPDEEPVPPDEEEVAVPPEALAFPPPLPPVCVTGAGAAEVNTACCTATAISRETFVTACSVAAETACVAVGSFGTPVTTTWPVEDWVTDTVMTISCPCGTERPETRPVAETDGAGVGTPLEPPPPPVVAVPPAAGVPPVGLAPDDCGAPPPVPAAG